MPEKSKSKPNPIICRTDHLTKVYQDGTALQEISLTVHKGDIFGLIGRMGPVKRL